MLRTSSSTDSSTSATQIVVDYDGVDDDAASSMLRASSSTESSTSATQIAVKYDGVDGGGGKSVEKSLKNRRKVIKS